MLERLEIEDTRDTPYVCFDAENSVFEIKGNSLPEDSIKFFEPVFSWISRYSESPGELTHLVCKLDYFNSSSAKMLYEVFYEFEKIAEMGNKVKVTWYYDPEDKLIEEKGQEYQAVVDIPFELKEISPSQ